jgi:transcription termination/antitermination protein NusG
MMVEVEQKWYVVQVLSGQEKKTKKALDECVNREGLSERVQEVLLPTERVSEVKGGEQKIVERRIWPGYLLIKMSLNDETWQHIRQTNGVIGFLGGGAPTALSDAEVEQILQELKDKKETVTTKHKFKVGSRVKIIDGVFVNFIGTVTAVQQEKGRLNVLVSIFGRDTQVDDLEFWQVEEASDEE